MIKLTDKEENSLKTLVKHFQDEDKSIRETQVRSWRKLKLLWDGFQRTWYSEVAHDWRVYDPQQDDDQTGQDYYDKPVNVFRAYLEAIIAALSVTIPAIKCYPDDADSPLDLSTAKAGDKIAELVDRHNNVSLLWLHALYIYVTEGMVACYNYTKESEEYGTYEDDDIENTEEEITQNVCPVCQNPIDVSLINEIEDEYDPQDTELQDLVQNQNLALCPQCLIEVEPKLAQSKIVVSRVVGKTSKPKARQCLEVYGGLYVKVANYAKKQSDTPYLDYSYETNYTFARDRYPKLRDKIGPNQGGSYEPYERWARMNPQYMGAFPLDTVTVTNMWIRPSAFEYFDADECDEFKEKFPNGCKVVMIDDNFAEACNEKLDDHWTLTNNPLADFLYFDPPGMLLTSIQDITNDLVSLTLQTIEHGIPQTFVDPGVVNFGAYKQMETTPGALYAATPKSGKSLNDAFHEVKTAILSQEVMPFASQIQSYGQLVSGAQPSLFGGELEGSKTASEYSMSRSQALQRQNNVWKMFIVWWKEIHGKVIPAYIKTVVKDQRFVERRDGGFVNTFIRKAELEGKIGSIELEANENLPITWAQRRDNIWKLFELQSPEIQAMIFTPENLPLIYESIGVTDFSIPGEDDRNLQYSEINQLLNSQPIPQPLDEMQMMEEVGAGVPVEEIQPIEETSVPIDPIMDNHAVHFEICRKWVVSEAGQLAKVENEQGYKNVLLHAIAHKEQIDMQMMAEVQNGAAPPAKSKEDQNAPIKGDQDVKAAV